MGSSLTGECPSLIAQLSTATSAETPDCLLVHAASVMQIATGVISHFRCDCADIHSPLANNGSRER